MINAYEVEENLRSRCVLHMNQGAVDIQARGGSFHESDLVNPSLNQQLDSVSNSYETETVDSRFHLSEGANLRSSTSRDHPATNMGSASG